MTVFKTIKDQAKARADRLVNSTTAQRLLSSPEVQRAMAWASETKTKVRENFTEAKKSLSEILALEAEDDLRHLKRRIDQLVKADKDKGPV